MENFTAQTGLTSAGLFTTGQNTVAQQPNGALWRPWTKNEAQAVADNMPNSRHGGRVFPDAKHQHPKSLQFTHPVKLFWPKKKCFDYLYQDAEMLLRNYPCQATICVYEDSSSDEDMSDDDEEEENDKQLN